MAKKQANPGKTPVTGDVWGWDGSTMSLMAPQVGAIVTANFAQPVPTQSVTVSLSSSRWLAVGMIVFITTTGYFEVIAVPSINSATLKNLGYAGAKVEGATVLAGNGVVAAGLKGTDGKGIISATVAPTSGDGNDGDYWYNQNTKLFYGPKGSGVWPAGFSLQGADGKNVELQSNGTHIQWRKVGDTTWINLIALSSLQGPKGDPGNPGAQGPDNVIRFFLSNGPVFRKLVTLPTSGAGTYDDTVIEGAFGGWGGSLKCLFNGRFSNREGFTYDYNYSGVQSEARIRAYQQTDGTVIIGVYATSQFAAAAMQVITSQGTVDLAATQTTVTGTLVFDSAVPGTYPPTWRYDTGGFTVRSALVSPRRFSTALTSLPAGYLTSRNVTAVLRGNDTTEEYACTLADLKALLSATSSFIPNANAETASTLTLFLGDYYDDPTGHPLSFSVAGGPSGLSLNSSNGVYNGSPVSSGTYSVLVTATDILGWTYSRSFQLVITGSAVNKLYYEWDTNSKSYWAYAQVTDSSESVNYEVLLLPLQGQSGPAQTYRLMEAGSWLKGSITYNRRYQYVPGFAGGVDVVAGWWRQRVRKQSDTSISRQADVQLVAGTNSSTDITNNSPYTGPSNQAPVWGFLPNQTISRKRAWGYTIPAATDPEGQALTYSITGLPSGLSFNASTRVISGTTSVGVGNFLVTVTATDTLGASTPQSFYIIVAVSLCSDFRQYTSNDSVGNPSLMYEYYTGSGYPRAFSSTGELVSSLQTQNTSPGVFDYVRVTGGNWALGSRVWSTNNPSILDEWEASNYNDQYDFSKFPYDEAGWIARNPVYSAGVLQSAEMIRTDTCGYIVEIRQYIKGSGAGVVGSEDIFNPAIQWSGGKARVVNTASPSIPSGYTLYFWISGGTPTTSLPSSYDYDPGDQVTIYAAIANNTDPIPGTFYPAYSVITF